MEKACLSDEVQSKGAEVTPKGPVAGGRQVEELGEEGALRQERPALQVPSSLSFCTCHGVLKDRVLGGSVIFLLMGLGCGLSPSSVPSSLWTLSGHL